MRMVVLPPGVELCDCGHVVRPIKQHLGIALYSLGRLAEAFARGLSPVVDGKGQMVINDTCALCCQG